MIEGRMDGTPGRWIDDVLRFWFVELAPREWWGSAAVDASIRARFPTLYDTLKRAPPDPAALDARAHLAAVIVFDQFPRNLFRDAAQAFATDALALGMAEDAIDRALDAALDEPGRQFLWMPLMHSEDVAVQRRSLALFASLGDPRALRAAREHHDAIARFGRFPWRNAALGRESTNAELAFLEDLARRREARR